MSQGQRPEHRVGRQVAGDGLGIRVQVEQAAAALHRGGQVAQVLELELAVDIARSGAGAAAEGTSGPRDKMPVPFGSWMVRRYRPSCTDSTPGMARAARKPSIRSASIGAR